MTTRTRKKCSRCGCHHEPLEKKTEIIGYQKVAPKKIPIYSNQTFNEIIDVFFNMHYNQDIPIIKAHEAETIRPPGKYLVFWCDYCKVEHLHGRENGHRTAHCERGLYEKHGYFLNEPLLMGQKIF